MKRLSYALVLLAVVGAALPACSTAPKTTAEQATLANDVNAALASFKNADASLHGLLDKSVGYAVYPDIGKAGFIAGGSFGQGEVFERGGKKIGYSAVSKATVGLQAGAQTFAEIIIFLNQKQFSDFQSKEWAFAADISAVAVKSGAAGSADPSKGVIVFVMPKGGLMAEASIGGQRFKFQPF